MTTRAARFVRASTLVSSFLGSRSILGGGCPDPVDDASPPLADPTPPPTRASLSSQAADREWIVFLIDASPAMLARAPPSVAASVPGSSPSSTPRTYLDVAVECAQGTLRSRIVSAPSDKQAVVFFATRETRGVDDAASGLSAREGVYVDQRLGVPSARRIQDLADLRGPEGVERFRAKIGSMEAPAASARDDPDPDAYYDALLRAHHACREMLDDRAAPGAAAARTAKRVLLFTNRDDPRSPAAPNPAEGGAAATRRRDGRELAAQWREFRDVHGIDVCLFTLPTTPVGDHGLGGDDARAFDASRFYAPRLLAVGAAAAAGGEHAREPRGHELVRCDEAGGEALPRLAARKFRRARRTRSTTLRFGPGENHRIAICLHAPLAAAARPKAIQVHARDLTEVHSDAVFVSKFAGEFVSREHLTRRFVDVGDARVALTPAELAGAKRSCGVEGVHVLGFRPRASTMSGLRWAQTSRPARLARPADEKTQPGACAAFAALLEAMVAKDRVAIALVSRGDADDTNAQARCVALAPAEEADFARGAFAAIREREQREREASGAEASGSRGSGARYVGLHVIHLPFLDDVRRPELAHATAPRVSATEAQVRAAEDLAEALAVHAYDPADISNPTLARHYRALETTALDLEWDASDDAFARDATAPPSAAELEAVGARAPAEALKRAAYGENHDAEAAEDATELAGAKRRAVGSRIGGGLEDEAIDFAALARADELERCTAAALKRYCKEHALPVTGVKAALAERVKAHASAS